MPRVKAAQRSVFANTPGLPVTYTITIGPDYTTDPAITGDTHVSVEVDNGGRTITLRDVDGVLFATLTFNTIYAT